MTEDVFEGQCQCGAIRYRVAGKVSTLFACHCTECQRQSGSAFGMALWIKRPVVDISGGTVKEWIRTMPSGKAFADQPGSGLHVHVSLWTGYGDAARCVFQPDAGAGDPPGANLSALGRHFIAGVLHHAAALCALAAPTVNSYKRLVVGESLSGTTWAPAYVAHGPNNRTAMVRTLPGRFEWRVPDASANPYLATAALAQLLAGLDAGWDLDLMHLLVEAGYLNGPAQRRLGEADRAAREQCRALALEHAVALHVKEDVEIARW